MNPRVGYISYGLDRSPGGIGRYTRELATALGDNGVSLTVLRAGRTPAIPGTVGLPGAGLLPGLLSVGQLEIALAARKHHLDLVHDPTGCAPLLPTMLTGARCVVTIHDVIPFIHPATSSRLDLLIYRLWLPLLARRLDAVVTVSQQSRSDIVRYLGVKPEMVYVVPGAASALHRPVSPAEARPVLEHHGIDSSYILYVGSIEPRKNLHRLIEAFAALRRWSNRWTLVVVGARRWKSSPVYDVVRRLGLTRSVHFAGYVPDEDLPALYSGASMFVFPSVYEGFGLPVLEAMACGAPVVTSNTSSLPEVAGDAAILVNPRDGDAIATAMRRVLEDLDLAADLRSRGLARARQFTWQNTARKITAIYGKVLGQTECVS